MNKKQIVDHVAETVGLEKKKAAATLNAIIGCITDTLGRGDKVSIMGFGSFSIGERKQRQGKNPRTGETITIPAKTFVKFKAGKILGETVEK